MTAEDVRRHRAMREKIKRKKRKRTIQICARLGMLILGILMIWGIVGLIHKLQENKAQKEDMKHTFEKKVTTAPDFEVQLLTPNFYSRPQTKLKKVNGIVIHYVANPGTSAAQNRSYFEGLKDSKITKASSHFIVGLEGEILQCIPTAEIAYASNERNADTIAIEVCHPDATGKFNQETYESLIHLVAWLCGKFDLTTEDVIRHYDVTGKACPLYFVEHEDAWQQFLQDICDYIELYGTKEEEFN